MGLRATGPDLSKWEPRPPHSDSRQQVRPASTALSIRRPDGPKLVTR
jgi:hypothetical protein